MNRIDIVELRKLSDSKQLPEPPIARSNLHTIEYNRWSEYYILKNFSNNLLYIRFIIVGTLQGTN